MSVPADYQSGVEISSSDHSPWSCRAAACRERQSRLGRARRAASASASTPSSSVCRPSTGPSPSTSAEPWRRANARCARASAPRDCTRAFVAVGPTIAISTLEAIDGLVTEAGTPAPLPRHGRAAAQVRAIRHGLQRRARHGRAGSGSPTERTAAKTISPNDLEALGSDIRQGRPAAVDARRSPASRNPALALAPAGRCRRRSRSKTSSGS